MYEVGTDQMLELGPAEVRTMAMKRAPSKLGESNMKTEKELRVKLGNLQTRIDKINLDRKTEHRDFTEEERAEVERIMSEQDLLTADIKKAGIDTRSSQGLDRFNGSGGEIDLGGGSSYNETVKRGYAGGVIGAKSYEDVFGKQELNDDGFRNLSDWLLAVRTSGMADKRLRFGKFEERAESRTASEGIPSDGGFFVPGTMGAAIINSMIQAGEMLARCQIFPLTNSNTIKIPAWKIPTHSGATHTFAGGLVVSRTNEGGLITGTSPKVRQIQMALNKLTALVVSSNELISDSDAYSNYLIKLISDAMLWVSEYELVRGTGAGEFLGLLTSPSLVTVDKVALQVAATVVYQNILDMLARFWKGFKNPVWIINADCEPQLKQMAIEVGTGGTVARWAYDVDKQLLEGIPVIWSEHASALGDVGDVILTDLSMYGVALAGSTGVQIAQSEHVRFDYDQTCFRGVYRNDGQSLQDQVFTPENGTTKSNIVTLEERT